MHVQAHAQLYLNINVYIDRQSSFVLLVLLIIFLQKIVKTRSLHPLLKDWSTAYPLMVTGNTEEKKKLYSFFNRIAAGIHRITEKLTFLTEKKLQALHHLCDPSLDSF